MRARFRIFFAVIDNEFGWRRPELLLKPPRGLVLAGPVVLIALWALVDDAVMELGLAALPCFDHVSHTQQF